MGGLTLAPGLMYTITQDDVLLLLADAPQSSIGAPCPMVVAGEHSLHLAYYLETRQDDWDGRSVRVVSDDDADEPCALIGFHGAYAHMFGPPNDEAISGHPLANRGLQPYGAYEVQSSSWLHQLELMNSVHPQHQPRHFSQYRHFIFTFHDSTFECIAKGFAVSTARGTVWSVLSGAARSA